MDEFYIWIPSIEGIWGEGKQHTRSFGNLLEKSLKKKGEDFGDLVSFFIVHTLSNAGYIKDLDLWGMFHNQNSISSPFSSSIDFYFWRHIYGKIFFYYLSLIDMLACKSQSFFLTYVWLVYDRLKPVSIEVPDSKNMKGHLDVCK